MLLIISGYVAGTSLILPVSLAFKFMTSCTIRAIARNASGASNRRPVAHRLRQATRPATQGQHSGCWTLLTHPQQHAAAPHCHPGWPAGPATPANTAVSAAAALFQLLLKHFYNQSCRDAALLDPQQGTRVLRTLLPLAAAALVLQQSSWTPSSASAQPTHRF